MTRKVNGRGWTWAIDVLERSITSAKVSSGTFWFLRWLVVHLEDWDILAKKESILLQATLRHLYRCQMNMFSNLEIA